MAITIYAPTCWPIQRWAVFSFTRGVWKLVLDQPTYLDPPLVAIGSDIRETTDVHRTGDPRCIPSGGSRARLWHWNGARLVAGPWKQVTPPTSSVTNDRFKTPSGNIVCEYFFNFQQTPGTRPESVIRCGIHSGLKPPPPLRPCREGDYTDKFVGLSTTGSVFVQACAGDPGPFVGEGSTRVLAYGKTWSGGGLRCSSAATGLTCRNTSGHGFSLNRERWRSF